MTTSFWSTWVQCFSLCRPNQKWNRSPAGAALCRKEVPLYLVAADEDRCKCSFPALGRRGGGKSPALNKVLPDCTDCSQSHSSCFSNTVFFFFCIMYLLLLNLKDCGPVASISPGWLLEIQFCWPLPKAHLSRNCIFKIYIYGLYFLEQF